MKKENFYAVIAAISGMLLFVIGFLWVVGGVKSLFELPFVALLILSFTVILIGFCFFFGTKSQILQKKIMKSMEQQNKDDSSLQTESNSLKAESDFLETESDFLRTQSDFQQKKLDSLKNLTDSLERKRNTPVFKVDLN
ncbi:hypothetical protein A3A09_03200 [Candidatus Nomurabacteria bacterium RIFCSPLOWO2_01_FULL_42_20]|uniref:Uncharacterized protein n=1 Tax=Candidatus Nomurabacteria bacterium RIFCSPHIGHO2_01_FULL_42_16 TaxID=1801743 RepID=A0A1F6VLH5_9BACT|nr:MAG: hypothetical protein A2824_02445 [Candidatus Nomurabacteria bacterium RIFCSPHIGHO2_01_FULL_42_16]OGI92677.1 MAG: hypothetical protein A3A09_03200 [Candidatus Nomurabacteria bacterium RIFCSPLOWO2_01_FULL_42_20]